MYIIDRIEGNIAICESYTEDGNILVVEIEKSKLPKNAKEGDCILKKDTKYIIDIKTTNERKQNIEQKFKSLFRN